MNQQNLGTDFRLLSGTLRHFQVAILITLDTAFWGIIRPRICVPELMFTVPENRWM